MFVGNLSSSLLRLCKCKNLSHKTASLKCGISYRYFSEIARGKAAASITTLEKLCLGFRTTPDGLLIKEDLSDDLSFRKPMSVCLIRSIRCCYGNTTFPVCPRCGTTMEREYQQYCDRCGQCLDWVDFSSAVVIPPII